MTVQRSFGSRRGSHSIKFHQSDGISNTNPIEIFHVVVTKSFVPPALFQTIYQCLFCMQIKCQRAYRYERNMSIKTAYERNISIRRAYERVNACRSKQPMEGTCRTKQPMKGTCWSKLPMNGPVVSIQTAYERNMSIQRVYERNMSIQRAYERNKSVQTTCELMSGTVVSIQTAEEWNKINTYTVDPNSLWNEPIGPNSPCKEHILCSKVTSQ